MMPIIDVHCHLGQFTNARMSADAPRLSELFEQAGVMHGVTFSIEACYGAVDQGNCFTLREVERADRLSAMVVANPEHPESSARWIREAVSNPKIVGVKIHPALANFDVLGISLMRLIDKYIGPSGLPILSHVGNDSPNVTIDKYLELASRFPQVRFIAAHLGIGVLGPDDTAVNAWARNPQPNVWFDMGTLRSFCNGAVEHLLAAVGPDRICFGTDAPLYHPAPFVRLLETLNITEEVRAACSGRTLRATMRQVTILPLRTIMVSRKSLIVQG